VALPATRRLPATTAELVSAAFYPTMPFGSLAPELAGTAPNGTLMRRGPLLMVGAPSSTADWHDTDLCYLSCLCTLRAVPSDAELTYADHVGRFYARRYAFPPMVGRLLGYLAVCDPPDQSIGDLAEALLASRSAIAGAVKALETMHAIRRSRAAGERMDRVRMDLSSPQSMGMDITEYEEMSELAREGLELLRDAPVERRAVLLEMSAFADLVVEEVPKLQKAWKERRAALVLSGELAEQAPRGRSR